MLKNKKERKLNQIKTGKVMMAKRFIYILVFIFGCGMLQAQVKFNAKVSKRYLGINERLRVDFEMRWRQVYRPILRRSSRCWWSQSVGQ